LCANGHRFSTLEVHIVHTPSRDRAIADAVVLRGMRIADAAKEFGLKSDSYVSRCVKRHYPNYDNRSIGQIERYRRQRNEGGSAASKRSD
jgi:transposase